jgi:hypothetical protein
MRDRARLSVFDIEEQRIPFGEAIALVYGFRDEMGTRTHASVNDWAFPATIADLVTIEHAEWYMNAHRTEKSGPIRLPRPWPAAAPAEAQVTDEERARLRAILAASSTLSAQT